MLLIENIKLKHFLNAHVASTAKFVGIKMKFKKISISIDDIARFRKKVSTDGECHLWKGKPDKDGYGVILCKKSLYRSHRIAYFIFNGNMDTDLVIDHMCKNRLCCNPMHLRAVTQIINASENTDAVKTHCKNGHDFSAKGIMLG